MPSIKWEEVFSHLCPVSGATDAELLALSSSICHPLTKEEIRALKAAQLNPFPETDPLHAAYKPFDPERWLLPTKPLPRSFMEFLKWSNGGTFISGERRFDPVFSTSELREYLIAYNVPEYMPNSLPFAFDGYGDFYLFDMRRDPVEGEYPILFTLSGNLGYEVAILIATSFVEACKGTTNPSDLYFFGE